MSTNGAGYVTQSISGWGRFPVERCHVFRPEKQSDIKSILSSKAVVSYISRGLGRSYGDAALNREHGIILHTRLNRFLAFDEASGVVECEAGVSQAEIIQYFLPRGYFLPVTPGTKFVTMGGAIAADVHGKNHHKDGTLANFVLNLKLLTPRGELLSCSRESNSEIFWATLGGMGLTGIILSARLKLRKVDSAYVFVDYRKALNLEDALAAMGESDEHYQYSVAWIDCLATGDRMGRSVLMRGNHALAAELPHGIGNPLRHPPQRKWNLLFDFPSLALNPLTVKAFNALFSALHRDATKQVVTFEKFFYPLDSILNWNRMYGKRGFVQYQVALPPASGPKGLAAILERLTRSQGASFLAVLKRFGEANPGLLSFPFAGYTLALDLPMTRGLVPLLHELDRMVLEHSGRVYLAKDAVLSAQDFAAMYPRLAEFRVLKKQLDPDGLFSSSQARRLGIVEI